MDLNAGLMKKLTSGNEEAVTARFLRGHVFDFPFLGTIWVSTNHIPNLGNDQALYDRFPIIPFDVRIADHEIDLTLKSKLVREAPGILNWVLDGALAFLLYGLEAPPEVVRASEDTREDQDELAEFIAERCVLDPYVLCPGADLYASYLRFMEGRGRPLGRRAFGMRLQRPGITLVRDTAGMKGRGWEGITPKDSYSLTETTERWAQEAGR
jgi:putative DNA primase/helicase